VSKASEKKFVNCGTQPA